MHCPFLEGKRILACRSLGAVYVPSMFELDGYCRQEMHKNCPFYRGPAHTGTTAKTDDALGSKAGGTYA
jgi:hypothetical protein